MTDREELENWIEDFSRKTVTELLYSINKKAKEKPVDLSQDIFIHLISSLIGTVIYSHLKDASMQSKKLRESERTSMLTKSYSLLKSRLQDSIATAFTSAMSLFTGKTADYCCLVKVIPPAINKEPC